MAASFNMAKFGPVEISNDNYRGATSKSGVRKVVLKVVEPHQNSGKGVEEDVLRR